MEGFDQLYRSSVAEVYAYVATLLGDRAAAEDVTAAAFERAWRKRRTFDAGRGSPRGLLGGRPGHAGRRGVAPPPAGRGGAGGPRRPRRARARGRRRRRAAPRDRPRRAARPAAARA